MAEVIIHETITAIPPADWNACFPGEVEDYDYFLVTEQAGLEGFCLQYLTVIENGRIVAATTVFFTEYALDTTLQGFGKQIVAIVKKVFPRLFSLKLACLGAPETECCYLGFHPTVDEMSKPLLLKQLLTAFEYSAQRERAGLLGIKDVPASQKTLWDLCCQPRGYKALASLATAVLPVSYATIDDYLLSLSASTRKDMRRKLKKSIAVRVEERCNIDDVIDVMMTLYQETKQRSDWQLVDLTADYFTGILKRMDKRALCLLYYVENVPIAFNLLLFNQDKLLDKFFCQGKLGRQHNLYFLSWLFNVSLCIEMGISCYQSGQVGYETKLRLGSQLINNWLYFKHRNPLINWVLRLISPWFEVEQPGRNAEPGIENKTPN